ncbi:odorant receptor 10-like isoform X2 [Rhodnius prolixus]|uniref:odorant receptor 10-like isoform X2 n=1 Tax=Rhodnius prolixus TaxID=13249 RepID=UPI003D1892FC
MNGIDLAKSTYFSSLGITGLAAFLKSDNPPLIKQLWVGAFLIIILPAMFTSHLYSAAVDTSATDKFTSLGLGLDQLQITLKSLFFVQNIKRIRRILLQFETFHCVNCCGVRALEILSRKAKFIKRIQNTYNCASFMCFLSWILAPVVLSPEGLFLTRNVDKMMKALPPIYPFRIDYFPMVQIVYLIETIMTMGALMHFTSLNLFFFTTLVLLCVQFQILNESLHNNGRRKAIRMNEFVIDHQRLLRICQEAKDALSPLLAVQLLISLLTICFAIFELTMINEDYKEGISQIIIFFRKSTYTVIIFAELLLYCWLSSELQNSCDSIREGLYFSPWYENLKNTSYKDYIIINCRAMRPFKLTALFLINIQLSTFLEVVKASYSYYTVLKRMHN